MSNLVLLKRTYEPGEAHIIKGLLESNDIPVFLMDEGINSVQWLYQIAVGGVRIMVLSEDLEDAKKLLNIETETYIEPDKVEYSLWQNIVKLLFFIGGFANPFKQKYKYKNDD